MNKGERFRKLIIFNVLVVFKMVVEFLQKYIQMDSFHTTDQIFQIIFVLLAAVSVCAGMYSAIVTSPIHCHHKTISEKKETSLMKDVNIKCSEKYRTEFNTDIILGLFITSNLLVFVLSIIYGRLVKNRVKKIKIEAENTNNDENDTTRLTSPQETNTRNDWKHLRRFSTFNIYITYLLFARIIPLMAFVIFFYQSNTPVHFSCQYLHHTGQTSTSNSNVTLKSIYDLLIIGCTNSAAKRNYFFFHFMAGIDSFVVVVTFWQLFKIAREARYDEDFKTDKEFIPVNILELRKTTKRTVITVQKIFRQNNPQKMSESIVDVDEIYFNERDIPKDNNEKRDFLSEMLKREGTMYPRTICVIGESEITKTALEVTLFCKWLKGEVPEFLNDKIVILFQCKELSDETCSCYSLLAQAKGFPIECREAVLSIPSKAVLIFVGFDDLNEGTNVFSLFKKLRGGESLPGATVLASLRPTATLCCQGLEFDRKVEIFGFSKQQIYQYVSRRTEKNACEKLKAQFNKSAELLSFCHIPVYLDIVCLTLEESSENCRSSDIPKTVTEIYTRAVKVLTSSHENASSVSVNDCQNLLRLDVIAGSEAKEYFKEYSEAVRLSENVEIDDFLETHQHPKFHLLLQFVAGVLGDKIKRAKKDGIEEIEHGKIEKRYCILFF